MNWRLSRPLPARALHRLSMARALWLILLLIVPLTGHSAACRPVTAEQPVAAKRQGRRFVGVDLSPKFCNEAAQRVRAADQPAGVFMEGRSSDK